MSPPVGTAGVEPHAHDDAQGQVGNEALQGILLLSTLGAIGGLGPILSATAAQTGTPEGDLDAWADEHVAGVERTAAARQEDDRPKRGVGPIDPEGREARNRRRTRAAEGTRGEIDKEMTAAREGGVTADEVADIKARKEAEARIEMNHGLELTATDDKAAGDTHWSLDELAQIEEALAVIPSGHLRKVERVNRSKQRGKSGGMYDSDDSNRTLNIYDAASLSGGSDSQRSDKITGRERRSGRYQSRGKSSNVGDVFQHEIGHAVAEDMPETYKRFTDAAGWRRVNERGLKDLPDADQDALKKGRAHKTGGKGHDHDHDHDAKDSVSAGGKKYSLDPYSQGYLVRDEGSVPEGSGWQYAAAAPEEHFAEVYAKALQVPESLHEDLITGPQRQLSEAVAAVTAAAAALRAASSPYDPAYLEAAQRFQAATSRRDAAQAMVTSRQKQWTIMREEVFGVTDARVEAEVANLRRAGAKDDAIEAFRGQASKAMTPHQLRTLATRYTPTA